MNNFLDNGTVLPHGLLAEGSHDAMAGFNKSYRNTALKAGIVVASYSVKEESNRSKLATEYDVLVIEQAEDRGSTTILYKNCLSSEGLGSIADFFEANLRAKKKKTSKGNTPTFKGQDGAIVLLLCLDGVGDRAIVVGSLVHPDRKTTLVDSEPHLEGEYNGVNIKVEKDGSTTFTFKGATGNDGKVLDKEQGTTTLKVEKDGSFQADHKTIKMRLDKKGKASLTADDDISNTTKKNFNVTATENVDIKATKDFSLECDKLMAKASGSAMLECQKLEIKAESEISLKGSQLKVEAEALVMVKAPVVVIDGIVALGGPVGQPVLLLSTMFIGVGNLGIPVISNAIQNFATKVTAI